MNMIQSAKDQVLALTTAAYQKAAAAGLLPEGVTLFFIKLSFRLVSHHLCCF